MTEFSKFRLNLSLGNGLGSFIDSESKAISPTVQINNRMEAKMVLDPINTKLYSIHQETICTHELEITHRLGFVGLLTKVEFNVEVPAFIGIDRFGDNSVGIVDRYTRALDLEHEQKMEFSDELGKVGWLGAFGAAPMNGSWVIGHFEAINGNIVASKSGSVVAVEEAGRLEPCGDPPKIYNYIGWHVGDAVASLDLLRKYVVGK